MTFKIIQLCFNASNSIIARVAGQNAQPAKNAALTRVAAPTCGASSVLTAANRAVGS